MNFYFFSLPVLLAIFAIAAIAIWIAGIQLSNATDKLATYFELGEALGGMIILAIVTNLPEMAIVVSASVQHNIDIAVGNVLGGIAIQTVVLVILDAFGLGRQNSLTYKAASLTLVLEGFLVLIILSLVVVGHQLPSSLIFLRVTPISLLIFTTWVVGLKLVAKANKVLPWIPNSKIPEEQTEPQGNSKEKEGKAKNNNTKTGKTIVIFIVCAVVTLIAGIALEKSGDAISTKIGMQGVLFGATVLAAATSLPEVSTGLASVKMKDYQMAVSDIFGGNAFLPVLFFLATLFSGDTVLPKAQKTDIYLTGLAMILTIVYCCGLLFRPKKQVLFMGLDSFIVLVLYLLGIVGLFTIAK